MNCYRRRAHSASPRARRGFTILEVLMAIGIAIIGLFGVWALIPIAGQKTQNALLQDDKSALGRSAFREFEVRGARQSDTWLMSAKRLSGSLPANRLVRVPEAFMPGQSFCIDPHLFAEAIAAGSSDTVATFPANSSFPTPPPPGLSNVAMVRLTMLRAPLSQARIQLPDGSGNPTGPPVRLPPRNSGFPLFTIVSDPAFYPEMSASLAASVFQGADDIIVNSNDDATLPAVQQYLRVDPNDQTSAPTRRASRGALSWMATLVPSRSNEGDSYHLSVAILNEREVASSLSNQEFVYNVVDPTAAIPSTLPGLGFPGGGIGGGEVVLHTPAVAFQRNDWVMLARRFPKYYFAWYRVVAVEVDSDDPDPAKHVAYVTLQGQDWNTGLPSPQQDNVDTQLFYIKGVVGVYEKTIRIETSSLWKLE